MADTNFGPVYTLDMDKFGNARAQGVTKKQKEMLEGQIKENAENREREKRLEIELDKADLEAKLAEE